MNGPRRPLGRAVRGGRSRQDDVRYRYVATFSAVTRQHILQAMAEHDARGADDFLGVYGYPAGGTTVEHDGRTYRVTAVLGVAHRYATGRLASADEFHGGEDAALALFGRRGFAVPVPAAAAPAPARAPRAKAPARPRAAAPARPRANAPREAPVVTCPTCSMVLPATGICDDCG